MTILSSCKDDDKTAFNLHNETGNTVPYVRIILENSTVDSSILPTSLINATVSAPANNVTSWSARVRIIGSSMTTPFVDIKTITTFPNSFSISIPEIADALGVNINDIEPADIIEFSGVSKGTDNTELEYDDLAGDLSGQPEQRQAYQFSVIVFCAPVSSNFIGDWTLDLVDLYGDGWDGAYITATVDGVETRYMVNGSGTVHVVTIPSDTQTLVWSYTSGSYEEEHTFTMIDPSGTIYGPFYGDPGIPFCFF
ncbi:hypothetical protein N9K49_00205 [Flavobacteriaceae bacterium]|nr:hypothetical protein [Flavobacteriaceae bacterium]